MDGNANNNIPQVELEISEKSKIQLEEVKCRWKNTFYRIFRLLLWTVPLLAALTIPIFFLIVYTSAVLQEHVEPILPFISDAGAVGLQASVFTQLMVIIAVQMMVVAFIRYKQLKYCFSVKLVKKKHIAEGLELRVLHRLNCINFAAYLVGIIGAVALTVPANFRPGEWLLVHTTGAFVAFTFMYMYSWLMVILCQQMASLGVESKPISLAVFSTIGTLGVIGCTVFTLVSTAISDGQILDTEFRLKWKPDQPGYLWHVLASVSEWILFNTYSLVLICLARRMKCFTEWHLVTFSK